MEAQFRRYFRDLLLKNGVWSASVEHRSGGSAGMCDLLVQLGEGLLPVELKLGEWRKRTQKMHCSRLRPAQIKLLDDAHNAGVAARLVIGIPLTKHWDALMLRNVSAERLSMWRAGFDLDELISVAHGGKLVLPVTRW